jgi:uncharacterized protein (TIGR00255 family)
MPTTMIRSMTGFGQAEMEFERYVISCEFRALNNKFMELNLRLPKAWQKKDLELRRDLTRLIERGSCHVNVSVSFRKAEDKILPINTDVVRHYLKELAAVVEEAGMSKDMLAQNIFAMPNLFVQPDEEGSEDEVKQMMEVVNKAFSDFEKFRMKEGEMLAEELQRMTNAILRLVEEVGRLEPERVELIRGRIEGEVAQLSAEAMDRNRFEQEIIYYLEKLDISEEKSRLINHCNYFLDTMKMKSSGKKLGFIAQEMGREINTLGAKANHFKIQQRVVEMKDELEKIKEQINNIL